MKFTDSHCHIDFDEFSTDLVKLLSQCQSKGISRLIVPAVSPQNWQRVLDLSHQHQALFSALGIHPWWVEQCHDDDLNKLSLQVETNRQSLIALGEIGIDGALKNHVVDQQANLEKQQLFFMEQMAIAAKFQLPVIIHHRSSHPMLHKLLKQCQHNFGGIIHAYSGSYEQAKVYLDLGFKLGIGGTITYERAKKTRNALKRLPINSLVLETDAPSMPLNGFQGQPNSPIRLINVFESLKELLNINADTLAQQLESNIDSVFFK